MISGGDIQYYAVDTSVLIVAHLSYTSCTSLRKRCHLLTLLVDGSICIYALFAHIRHDLIIASLYTLLKFAGDLSV